MWSRGVCGVRLLKYKRGFLPREVRASWRSCLLGLSLVLIALVGVIVKDLSVLSVWLLYFLIVASCFSVMFLRARVLRLCYHSLHSTAAGLQSQLKRLGCVSAAERWLNDGPALNAILRLYHSIVSQPVLFFQRSGSLHSINKAILYCRTNEDTQHIRVVHVYGSEAELPAELLRNIGVVDEEYPRIRVDLVVVQGSFGPEMIAWLSDELHVRRNCMFMGCPKKDFKHTVDALGGVRIITK